MWLWVSGGVEEETASEEEAEREKAGGSGRKELLSGGRLSSLCLSWDSSAALNMPVIFNRRRHRAAPAPLLQNILSARRGSGERSHSSWSHDPAQQEGEVVGVGGGVRLRSHASCSGARLRSARPDEAFRSNQMLRRQRGRGDQSRAWRP